MSRPEEIRSQIKENRPCDEEFPGIWAQIKNIYVYICLRKRMYFKFLEKSNKLLENEYLLQMRCYWNMPWNIWIFFVK